MLHASTQKLILKLCDLTERGEAPWREGDGDASWFETEGYRIEVKPEPPGVRVLQAGGREVESADAAQLGCAPFPGEPGTTYADCVRRMGLDARRIARGAEKAISIILSALSSPPVAEREAGQFSTAGGPESEAAMAAAVADMALRLKQQPLEDPARATAPLQVAREEIQPVSAAPPLKHAIPLTAAASPAPPNRHGPLFGAIASFAAAQPRAVEPPKVQAPVARPSPAPQPAPAQKALPSGLVVMGFHAVTVQTPETSRAPEPKPASSAGYRPWT